VEGVFKNDFDVLGYGLYQAILWPMRQSCGTVETVPYRAFCCARPTNKRSVGRDASSRTPGLAQYFIQSPAAHPAGAFHPKTKPTAKAMLLASAVGFTIYICI
jgi:hypothetical protein